MNVDIQACINGSKPAWDALVRQTAGLIYSAVSRAMKRCGAGQPEIEDRVQDVYLRLIQKDFRLLRVYDPQRSSLSTWLTLIARSVVHENQQKRRLSTVPLSDTDAAPSHVPTDRPARLDPALLHLLTERQRTVLRMVYEEGFSVEEAARRLDVDPQTIRSTKHKALTRLRQQMKNASNGGDAQAIKLHTTHPSP